MVNLRSLRLELDTENTWKNIVSVFEQYRGRHLEVLILEGVIVQERLDPTDTIRELFDGLCIQGDGVESLDDLFSRENFKGLKVVQFCLATRLWHHMRTENPWGLGPIHLLKPLSCGLELRRKLPKLHARGIIKVGTLPLPDGTLSGTATPAQSVNVSLLENIETEVEDLLRSLTERKQGLKLQVASRNASPA